MNHAYYRFLKDAINKSNEISTGMELLDRAFRIPLNAPMLIKGESGVGTTSLVLQLAKELANQNKLVIYVDNFRSGMSHRIADLKTENILVMQSSDLTSLEFLDILESFENEEVSSFFQTSDLVVIFENIFFLEKLWKLDFADFVYRLRNQNPNITIIATQRKHSESKAWLNSITMKHLQNIYTEDEDGISQLAGHLSEISGPYGKEKVFISHFTGQISRAYEYVYLEVEKGTKAKNSDFEFEGIVKKGAWNLIHSYEKNLRNELQIGKNFIADQS